MSETTKIIGQIIEGRRKQLGLSQAQLAKRTEVTQKTISAIENGKQAMNSGTMMKLARVLDLSPSEITGLEKTPLSTEFKEASLPEELRSAAASPIIAGIVALLTPMDEDKLRAIESLIIAFNGVPSTPTLLRSKGTSDNHGKKS